MATYDAAIPALDAQEDLKGHPEHCAADPARLATVGAPAASRSASTGTPTASASTP